MIQAITEAISGSSGVESSIAASMSATAAAHSATLTTVLPMGADPTSVAFAAALNARGVTYLGVHGLHAANREMFSGGQQLNSATIEATEAIRAAMAAL